MGSIRTPVVELLLLGPLLLAVTGCALAFADPPQVEVVQVELRGANLLDQAFGVVLCVTNPNASELAFQRIQIAVDLAGLPLAEGESEVGVRLPPRSAILVPFAVTTTIRNLGPQLMGVVRTGRLDYRLHGTVQLAAPLALSLPFSRSGHLGLISAGSDLLTDAAASTNKGCSPISGPVALRIPWRG